MAAEFAVEEALRVQPRRQLQGQLSQLNANIEEKQRERIALGGSPTSERAKPSPCSKPNEKATITVPGGDTEPTLHTMHEFSPTNTMLSAMALPGVAHAQTRVAATT
jgi:hypothetical protein